MASLDARRRSRRVVTEATWLPSRLDGVDVVHHGGGTVPPRSPGPIVLTIHDLQYRTFPEYLSPVKRQYLRLAIPRSVKRAAVVTVPTEYVRGTVIEAYGREPERVVVVPHGVDVPDAGHRRRRAARPLRPRRPALRRVPGDDPPPQEPRVPARPPGRAVERPAAGARAARRTRARRGRRRGGDRAARPDRPRRAPRPGVRRRSRRPRRRRRGARVPVRVRGVRGAGAGGDGPRHAGDLQRPGRPARGRRRRRPRAAARSRTRGRRRSTRSPRGARSWSPPAAAAPRCSRRWRRAPRSPTPTAGASPRDGGTSGRPLRIVVLGPHFEPDTAPTGRVLTRIVEELAARGHELHVVAALPWYLDARHRARVGAGGWCAGRSGRGARSVASTRSRARTSATWPGAPSASPASRCSPGGPGSAPAAGSGAPMP